MTQPVSSVLPADPQKEQSRPVGVGGGGLQKKKKMHLLGCEAKALCTFLSTLTTSLHVGGLDVGTRSGI